MSSAVETSPCSNSPRESLAGHDIRIRRVGNDYRAFIYIPVIGLLRAAADDPVAAVVRLTRQLQQLPTIP